MDYSHQEEEIEAVTESSPLRRRPPRHGVEEPEDPDSSGRRVSPPSPDRRSRCCCIVSSAAVVAVASLLLVFAMGSAGSVADESSTVWPVRDAEGRYQSYRENSRWVNWWSRQKPAFYKFFTGFLSATDQSAIPSSETELDRTLPVSPPYWLSDGSREVGLPGIRATWLGHATVMAEVDSALVLTDPIFSNRASAVQWAGPKRYRPPACTVAQLPDGLNAVVISHSHYDHLDYNSVGALHRKYGQRLHWFVPMDMGSWLRDNFQIQEANVHELVWWQEDTIPGTNVTVALTPSNHWGRRTAFDENHSLWGSWVVKGPRNSFWFGGDTAYAEEVFKQIGRKFGPFNLSAIPIGAYEPRHLMKYHHVNPEEAVSIHRDINSRRSLGIHWGTFKLTYEFYLEPKSRTKTAAEDSGLAKDEFEVVNLGETVEGI